jgi:hypothetical protein
MTAKENMDKTNSKAPLSLSVDEYTSPGEVYEFLGNSQNEHRRAQYSPDKIKKAKNKPTSKLLYLGISFSASKKKDSEPPSLTVRQDHFEDTYGTLQRVLISALDKSPKTPNGHAAVTKVMSLNLKQRNWEINSLRTNMGQVLEEQRLHSPLSNGYAKQWERRSRQIANEIIRLNKNSSDHSTPSRLAVRSEIILHALSKLPDKFGVCTDEDEISKRLKNAISQLDRNDQNKVAQLSLPVQLDPDGCNPEVIVDKLSFAFALNRVVRYFAVGDTPLPNNRDYNESNLSADIKILAAFAREEARKTGVRYKAPQEESPKPEHRHCSVNPSFDLTDAPLSHRAKYPPSSPREKEKVPERPRAQTDGPRSVVPLNSPREPQRHEPHKIARIAADQQKITPMQDRNLGKTPRIPTLDLQSYQEAPAPLKSPRRHSQKLKILSDNKPQYGGDAEFDREETGEEQRRIAKSSPDTGKAPYGGRKVAEHRNSQDLHPGYSQPATPRGKQILNIPSTSVEGMAERPVEKVIPLPDLSTVLRAGISDGNDPVQGGKNGDAAPDDLTESFMFDSIRFTLDADRSISPIKTIYPVPSVSKPPEKSEDNTPRAQSDKRAGRGKGTVQHRIPYDATRKYGSTSTSSTD